MTALPVRKHDPRPLHREVSQKLYHKKVLAWDIETRGSTVGDALYGEICSNGICCLDSLDSEPRFFSELDTFFAYVIENYAGWYIAAHNAKGYEFNYLKDTLIRWLDAHPDFFAETLHQGEQIIGFEITQRIAHTLTRGPRKGQTVYKEKHWHFLDTYPLFNDKLKNVAKAYCPWLPKGDVDFAKEDWNYANTRHRAYLVRDCAIILSAYAEAERLAFEAFAARLGRTAGSTAIHAFVASIPEGHVYYRASRHAENFARRAYRGGLVLPGTTTAPQYDVSMVDVKGAYGYQMLTHEYPVGAPVQCFRYMPGYIGVYHVHVTTPHELPFGIIPLADCSTYPLGEFNTVITSVELEYALTLGYTFAVYSGYFWTKCEPVFRPFMERCQELETREVEGRYPYKPLAKLMRNSLYGKFCTKTHGSRLHLLARDAVEPLEAGILLDPKTGEQIPGVYSLEEEIDEPFIMPIWGALITAYERVYLAQRAYVLYQCGTNSVYGDTDSIAASTGALERIRELGYVKSTGLYGGWEDEGRAAQFIVAAPKVYLMLEADGTVKKSRAKGLPMAQMRERYPQIESVDTYLNANTLNEQELEQFQFVTSNSVLSRLKHPERPIRLERKRRISMMSRSPNWDYDEKTHTITPKRVWQAPLDGVERTPVPCQINAQDSMSPTNVAPG